MIDPFMELEECYGCVGRTREKEWWGVVCEGCLCRVCNVCVSDCLLVPSFPGDVYCKRCVHLKRAMCRGNSTKASSLEGD